MEEQAPLKDDSIERALKNFYVQYPYCLNTIRHVTETWKHYSTPTLISFSTWLLRTTLDFQKRFTQSAAESVLARDALELTTTLTEALFLDMSNAGFRSSPEKAIEYFDSAMRVLEPQVEALSRSSEKNEMLVVPYVQLAEHNWLDIAWMIAGWNRAIGSCETPLIRLCARIRVLLDTRGNAIGLDSVQNSSPPVPLYPPFQNNATIRIFEILLCLVRPVTNRKLRQIMGNQQITAPSLQTINNARKEFEGLELIEKLRGGGFKLKDEVRIRYGNRAMIQFLDRR